MLENDIKLLIFTPLLWHCFILLHEVLIAVSDFHNFSNWKFPCDAHTVAVALLETEITGH